MAVITVTTALTTIATGTGPGGGGLSAVIVQAEGTVYVSKSAALTADDAATGGVILSNGQNYETRLRPNQKLYGRTSTGSVVVRTDDEAV
jgi:hypothetical protein